MHTTDKAFKKRFVIVSGPVCSGKTTLALNIAKNRGGCYYFDKDDLVPTSNSTFDAVETLVPADAPLAYDHDTLQKRDRHSKFFKDFIRNPEYDSTRDILIKGLQFNDFVIVNAPYTSELKKEAAGDCPAFDEFRKFFDKEECEFIVVFVQISKDELKARLLNRLAKDPAAAARDKNVYTDLDAYVAAENVTAPDLTNGKNVDRLFVFNANTDEERDASYVKLMKELGIENYEKYDRNIEVNRVI